MKRATRQGDMHAGAWREVQGTKFKWESCGTNALGVLGVAAGWRGAGLPGRCGADAGLMRA